MENREAMIYGVTIVPVTICGVLIVIISIYKIARILGSNDTSNRYLSAILLLGLLAFLVRVVGQLMYLAEMFFAFSIAEVPDFSAIADGLSKAMLYPLSGLGVLIMSLILWGMIKTLLVLNTRKDSPNH